jgi:hypothetical protein
MNWSVPRRSMCQGHTCCQSDILNFLVTAFTKTNVFSSTLPRVEVLNAAVVGLTPGIKVMLTFFVTG